MVSNLLSGNVKLKIGVIISNRNSRVVFVLALSAAILLLFSTVLYLDMITERIANNVENV